MARALIVVVVLAALLAVSGAAYVVYETEQAIITQFGEPVGEPVTEPGLHFKIPIIRKVHRFDKQNQFAERMVLRYDCRRPDSGTTTIRTWTCKPGTSIEGVRSALHVGDF